MHRGFNGRSNGLENRGVNMQPNGVRNVGNLGNRYYTPHVPMIAVRPFKIDRNIRNIGRTVTIIMIANQAYAREFSTDGNTYIDHPIIVQNNIKYYVNSDGENIQIS